MFGGDTSAETSVYIRATQHHIPEDDILLSHAVKTSDLTYFMPTNCTCKLFVLLFGNVCSSHLLDLPLIYGPVFTFVSFVSHIPKIGSGKESCTSEMVRIYKQHDFWKETCWVTLVETSAEGLNVLRWTSKHLSSPVSKDVEYMERYYFNVC
jgi:hypothetical protein